MFRRASDLIKSGDNIVGKKLLLRCLELNQLDAHSWLALARLEAKTGHFDKAKATFQQAAVLCPDNIHILHAWGHFEQKYGCLEIARDCWSKAMELDPLNAYVGHALSALEIRLGNYQSARDLLWDLVEKKPTAALCVALAELERNLGHADVAKAVLLKGLDNCKEEKSKILLALAWLEEDAFNNIDLAEKHIARAVEIDRNNIRAHVAKASLELRLNQVEKARQTLRNSTSLSAHDGQHYTMWSTLELETGNIDAARKIIEEGSKLYPGDHYLLQRWASFESKFGNSSKARELFGRSVLLKPHAPTFVAWAMLEEVEGLVVSRRINQYEDQLRFSLFFI